MVTLFALCVLFIFIFSCVLYPIKYKDEILKASNDYNLDPALICAVINAESSFNKNAKSRSGAVGLMQILPSTAEWVAAKLNFEYSPKMLYEPNVNINFGCYYLSYLLDKFAIEATAICAYNAGEGIVRAWLLDEKCSSNGKALNYIPYNETRYYLNKVLNNKKIYSGRV